VSLGLGILWIATLIGWLMSRRRAAPAATNPHRPGQPSTTDQSSARAAFQAACKANDASAARRNLLLWVNAVLPPPRILGLGDLAKRMDDPHLATLLRALDRGCYAGDPWNGAALAAALPKLTISEQNGASKPRELAPLYR
jgi:hypothetical protein